MENAAVNAVDHLLPEGYATVGIHLDVKHLKATPVGMKVTAKALLKEIDGKNYSLPCKLLMKKNWSGKALIPGT